MSEGHANQRAKQIPWVTYARTGLVTISTLAVLAALFWIGHLWHSTYHPLPWHDEWKTVAFLMKASQAPLDLSLWVAQHMEHRILVPRLIFAADFWWFGGEHYFTFAVSAITAVAIAFVLAVAAFRLEGNATERTCVALAIAACVLNGQQASNFLWAFQVQWFVTHFLLVIAVAAVILAARSGRSGKRSSSAAWIFAAAMCSLAANYTTASGVFVWVAVVTAATLLRTALPRRTLVALVLMAAAAVSLYFHGLRLSSAGAGSLALMAAAPLSAIQFYLAVLGGPFVPLGKTVAILSGGVFLAVAGAAIALAFLRRLTSRSSAEAMSLALLVFVLLSGLATTFGRSSLGLDVAMESRFASVSGLGWAALLLALANWTTASPGAPTGPVQIRERVLSWHRADVSFMRTAVLSCVGVLAGLAGFVRLPYDYSPLPEIKARATSAVLNGVDDAEILRTVGFLALDRTLRTEVLAFLMAHRRSIFRSNAFQLLGQPVSSAFIGLRYDCRGGVDRVEVLSISGSSGEGFRIAGWVDHRDLERPGGSIVIVNDAGVITGIGHVTRIRPIVADRRALVDQRRGDWMAHTTLRGDGQLVSAFLAERDARLCPISEQFRVN